MEVDIIKASEAENQNAGQSASGAAGGGDATDVAGQGATQDTRDASQGGRGATQDADGANENTGAGGTAGTGEKTSENENADTPQDYTICRPKGELDSFTVAAFREALVSVAEEPRLVVDLAEVTFMDSAGLGALIGGIRRARDNETAISVACSRESLFRLLRTTGFDRIVPVRESLEEAVQALSESEES